MSIFQTCCLIVTLSYLILNMRAAGETMSLRIVGGDSIDIDKVAYMVQIKKPNGELQCGGSLVSPKHVVTAGHCFNEYYYGLMSVVGGVSTLTENGVKRGIEDLFIHPEYNGADMHSDVAIALLDRPMMGVNMLPIPLCDHTLEEDDMIQVSGWGRQEKEGKVSNHLQTVELAVTSSARCESEFKRFVEKNMFCAADPDCKGIWNGDSGGGAVHHGQLCGIASFAMDSGVVGYASAFTDVYAVRSYIEDMIASSS